MFDFEKALKRPFTDFGKLAIGILLSIIPVINFIATGYQLNCAKTAMKKKFSMPEWKNIGDMFVSGILIFVIAIIYLLPALVVGLFTIGTILYTIFTTHMFSEFSPFKMASAVAGAGISMFGIFAVFLLMICGVYVCFSAILNFSARGKFSDAFQLNIVFKKAFTAEFFTAWIITLFYTSILTAVLAFIPWVGDAVGSFIGGITIMTALGEIYPKL